MAAIAENICEDKKMPNGIALRAYSDRNDSIDREEENELITVHLPMVRMIVKKVITYLKPPLTFEDMVSAGTVGLVRAARDFDPSQRAEFKTYAYIRIKGAILDELRGWSFMPANVNKKIRDAQELSRKIAEQTGVAPTDAELAEKLGISVSELLEMYESSRARNFVSLDGLEQNSPVLSNLITADETNAPDRRLERQELIRELAEAIRQLSQKHRQVILLYYQKHLTMKQIADVMEVTESRVSQLHAGALFNLSVKLKGWNNGGL
ncbi:MAG: FliA/WhiG family RNA polymerase sigma factor [Sedimentisphaerales bacterium]|nr:FliA/WhiG family RNA polymerase sigma factor [Sedimentisphaerales bacterium]